MVAVGVWGRKVRELSQRRERLRLRVRRSQQTATTGSPFTGYEEVGTYATTGAAMARDVIACRLGSGTALWSFTAHPDEFQLFTKEGSTTWVQSFERQP